jgi:dTDP-4-dehydrorhamnose 3,5-epimerase
MKLSPAGLHGSFLLDLTPFADDRGSFARTWDDGWAEQLGADVRMVQANLATSRQRGTTRGLHWQVAPYGEAKLLRCSRGALFDVAVDLRPGSPTYRQWQGHVLTAGDMQMVFVPEGCAHGYQSLEDDTETAYQVSHVYTPASERGIRWDDPTLQIAWPITDGVIVSEKDAAWPEFHWETDR